jgi:hypothetical protein
LTPSGSLIFLNVYFETKYKIGGNKIYLTFQPLKIESSSSSITLGFRPLIDQIWPQMQTVSSKVIIGEN